MGNAIEGKIVVITGASSGIGAATAAALAPVTNAFSNCDGMRDSPHPWQSPDYK